MPEIENIVHVIGVHAARVEAAAAGIQTALRQARALGVFDEVCEALAVRGLLPETVSRGGADER